jgi:GNAT superfamily N-acetyltransferase
MGIDLCNRLVDNKLTKKDLLEMVEIKKTTADDLIVICDTLSKAFDMSSSEEAYMQLLHSRAILDESVKLVDKHTGEIYGLLIFCEYPIKIGSPIIEFEPAIANFLDNFSQVNGHSFVIDERLRGTGIDKKMLYYNIEFLMKNYDLIWCGVDESLKTLPYWQRLGFVEIFRIPEATFLMLPLNKKLIQ